MKAFKVTGGEYIPQHERTEVVESGLKVDVSGDLYFDQTYTSGEPSRLVGTLADMIVFHKTLGDAIADAIAADISRPITERGADRRVRQISWNAYGWKNRRYQKDRREVSVH